MAVWNIKVNELVRELRRRTIGLKNSMDERRQVVKLHDSRFCVAEGYFRSNRVDDLVRQERMTESAHAE